VQIHDGEEYCIDMKILLHEGKLTAARRVQIVNLVRSSDGQEFPAFMKYSGPYLNSLGLLQFKVSKAILLKSSFIFSSNWSLNLLSDHFSETIELKLYKYF
jgi:hypothetical protein